MEADLKAAAAQQAEEVVGPVTQMLRDGKVRKALLAQKNQQTDMKNYIQRVVKQHRRVNKRINTELKSLEKTIGRKDFALLKDICTVNTPEQKNDKGEVVQEASKYVNKGALMREARNLIVLQREERIKKGLRKRSTGRSSKRASHSSMVKHLTQRNIEAAKENTTP